MTRAIHGRFLKEDSGAISDHLRNHVHLTNCIHLKNHMHRQSPILAERSLMRDLIALQRSRSLRDPSTSPPSWRSPSILDALSKKYEREAELRDGRRRSVGHDHRREARRFSGSSGPAGSAATSKVAAAEVLRINDGGAVTSGRSSTSKVRDAEGEGLEKSNRKGSRNSRSGGVEEASFHDSHNSAPVNDVNQGKTEAKDMRSSPKGKTSQNFHPKSLSEQLNGISLDNDDLHTSHFHFHGQRQEKSSEKPEASVRGHHKKPTRFKKRKLRGAKGARPSLGLREYEVHNEASVDSNSLAQGSKQHKHYSEGEDTKNIGQDGTRDPQNGCGIPWNWSRIHHRGKTFLDIAGRSLSCGLSESRLRKEGSMSHGGLDVPDTSYNSGSSHKSDAEATPLLVESLGSQESTDRAAWVHEYSGELGIFADHRVKRNVDSDLASEARSGERQKLRKYHQGRHLSLTQKYMPRTFRDLVGQNLAVQALSNAVSRRKVGFLYVFHGPHGTGKTSCARVFARALNCLSLEHPKPCGVCSPCVSHDLGKSRSIKEVGPVGNFDFENILDLLDNMNVSQLQSQYRVFIVDDCDALPPHSWSAISKVIDRSPRRVVFVLISTSLDNLPHIIISRCQKFLFSKLKDADIIYTLQWIATKEDLQIDKDALKLIASRSDGSLRDAEMTLEQLSLLGQRISVPLVQELVGLISDEKLVDLLDLALSADTVNTVKNLRDIMEAGGEPLALMSQLATVITDILAGSYVFTEARLRRKFFRRTTLSKDDMEKLRQALRTLSEAEKQLRASNDKLTWLTAALLQLAPDQQYLLPSSSTETSFNHSPFTFGNTNGRDTSVRGTSEYPQMPNTERGLLASGGKKHMTTDIIRAGGESSSGKRHKEIEKIWFAVLENIQSSSLKQFMYQEAKLVSVSFGAAQTIQLIFSSQMTKSMAEKYREHIVKAFEYVLGSPLTIEIRCESSPDDVRGNRVPHSESVSSRVNANQVHASDNRTPNRGYKTKPLKGDVLSPVNQMPADRMGTKNSEIIELAPSPGDLEHRRKIKGKVVESNWVDEPTTSHAERRKIEQPQSQSIVRSKVSLAHVIQQAEGTQRNGWSRRKAMSIAEKLEQENMRLEPRSRSLLCWKGSRSTRGKLSRLRIRTRRPRSLVKYFPCGRCVTKSPRYIICSACQSCIDISKIPFTQLEVSYAPLPVSISQKIAIR